MKQLTFTLLLLLVLFFSLSLHAQQSSPEALGVTLNGVGDNGTIHKDSLMKQATLRCANNKYTVSYYTVSYVIKGELFTLEGFGNIMAPETLRDLFMAHPSRKIMFEDIKGKDMQGNTVKLPSFGIYIKVPPPPAPGGTAR